MAYNSNDLLFRSLTDKEEMKFRKWARDNYKLGDEIGEIWHPVIKDECKKMKDESEEKVFFGYNRSQLKEAFDKVCDVDNWKRPIDKIVSVQDLSVVCTAVAFFVGGYPEVNYTGSNSEYRIKSPGYYEICGA
jgi:hypothetical protein